LAKDTERRYIKDSIEECVPRKNPLDRPFYTEAEIQALQAVYRGDADRRQQQMAMQFILRAAGTQDMPFDPENTSITDFRCGKMWVGQTIVWMLSAAPTRTDPDKIATRKVGDETNARPDNR